MHTGAARTTAAGEAVRLTGDPTLRPDTAAIGRLHLQGSGTGPAECPEDLDCDAVPAAHAQTDPADKGAYGNYDTADRPGDGNTIRTIVIHDTELPYDATLQSFQNPATGGSSHYVVRSSDGHVTQVVPTRDIAWHAGNWYVNAHAIGIEHEGFAVEGATWYSEVLYRSSARLVRYLAGRFAIPLDREHVIGHDEVPGPTQDQIAGMHWDPGPFWDWDHYMELLGAPPGEVGASEARRLPKPGATVVISPGFAGNTPPVTSCDSSGCQQLPAQPANFVELHTGPSPDAPLLSEPALHPDGSAGTTEINDWGDTAVSGQSFVVAAREGDWTAIWYGGRAAWFENPGGTKTATVHGGLTVTPRGDSPVAVYGRAYPEAAAFPPDVPTQTVAPLDATIQPGQAYVAEAPVASDYYRFKTVDGSQPGDGTLVRGETRYYPIEFNHRRAFVKVDDVRPARRGD
jgi:N-acetyl-anhydromuramyl-L-alanine amidase AmpD